MKAYILAALLGTMSAVDLKHRHHHRHSHHPKNIGVRFLATEAQMQDLPKVDAPKADAPAKLESKTAANTDLVAKATPEAVPLEEKVDQALAAAKASDAAVAEEAKAAAAVEETKKASAKKEGEFDVKKESKLGAIIGAVGTTKEAEALAPPPSEDEIRAANAAAGKPDAIINKEEYKEAQAKLKEMKAKLDEEPEPLPEDEQKAHDNKKIDDLVDTAALTKHEKQKALWTTELANLKAGLAEKKKLDNDPNDHRLQDEKDSADAQAKKDTKLANKLVAQLAKVDKELQGDREKAQLRKNDDEEEAAAEKAQKDAIAHQEKLLKDFELQKKKADNEQTAEFEKQLPSEESNTGKKEVKEEAEKLKAANDKIKNMLAEDEKAADAKAAEQAEAAAEQLPNIGKEAAEKAQADFDAQKAAAAEAAKAKEEAAAAAAAVAAKQAAAERARVREMKGEQWVSNLPSYIVDAAPYYPSIHKKH